MLKRKYLTGASSFWWRC